MSSLAERKQIPRPADDFFSKLSSSIKKGEFTPFLGAGASSLRQPGDVADPWNQVLQSILAINSHLKTKESQQFVSSFVGQRLGIASDEFDQELLRLSNEQGNSGDGESVFYKNGLIRLQVELINGTVRLTEYFGRVFSAETPPIWELASCSVPFDPAALDGADAINQLLKAAAIAQDLQGEPDEKRESPFLRHYRSIARSLEIKRLHEKLLTLIATLLGDKRDLYEAELDRHKLGEKLPIPEDVNAGLTSDFGRLRFDALHWMSELVWYTLRYWIPCYPTTAELAFELSLRVPKAPPRRAELAQAAQALENEYSASKKGSLAEDMDNIVRYCEHYQEDVPESVVGGSAFYYAIATALAYQFDLYKEQSLNDELESDDMERRSGAPTVPLAFSTNFDHALERVFERHDIGYHVVYPVIADGPRDGDVPIVWRLKTCYPESQRKTSIDTRWVNVPDQPTVPPRPGQFIGPMILKIHGAPCIKESESRFKHWLVLSETGYLEALATASNMPQWIKQQLGQGTLSRRALWFLGYSMSDWNVRLRLFEHCMSGTQSFRGTVDREADVYRRALLLTEKIHVEQWYADLSFLPQRILELFAIDQTRDVTGGTDKVAELVRELQRLLGRLEKRRRR